MKAWFYIVLFCHSKFACVILRNAHIKKCDTWCCRKNVIFTRLGHLPAWHPLTCWGLNNSSITPWWPLRCVRRRYFTFIAIWVIGFINKQLTLKVLLHTCYRTASQSRENILLGFTLKASWAPMHFFGKISSAHWKCCMPSTGIIHTRRTSSL